MLVFGIDVPLVEIILGILVVVFLLFVEAIILIGLITKQMQKSKRLGDLIEKLSETLLAVKKAEIEELEKLKVIKK